MKQDWCNIAVGMPWKGKDHFTNILTWLSQNVDDRDWDWDVVGKNDDYHRMYYFAHEKDALLFKLRWL